MLHTPTFAATAYDLALAWPERAGMAARRRVLVAGARGAVLEIGAGTGLNLPHYPTGLDELVLSEPVDALARGIEQRGRRLGRDVEVVRATAESLPFDDGRFDTVVCTLVLCSVGDPALALSEIRRVLRPGGCLLLIEHVRSADPRLARWQDRIRPLWKVVGAGCECNRRTPELLTAAGFDISGLHDERWRRVPPIVRPLVSGCARP